MTYDFNKIDCINKTYNHEKNGEDQFWLVNEDHTLGEVTLYFEMWFFDTFQGPVANLRNHVGYICDLQHKVQGSGNSSVKKNLWVFGC